MFYLPQSFLLAIAAPSDMALSLAQTTSSWPTREPMPQSVPVCTFSLPTTLGVVDQALGDQLRVLHQVRGVADHARHQDLAVRQLDVLPDLPLVLVAHVGRLDAVLPAR